MKNPYSNCQLSLVYEKDNLIDKTQHIFSFAIQYSILLFICPNVCLCIP